MSDTDRQVVSGGRGGFDVRQTLSNSDVSPQQELRAEEVGRRDRRDRDLKD